MSAIAFSSRLKGVSH